MRIDKKLAVSLAAIALIGAAVAVTHRSAPVEKAGATLPLKEFMGHVMQRNATQLWGWTAYISDEKGERYTKPDSDEEWEDAESDALAIVELGERLKIDERRIDENWDGYVNGVQQAARQSATAAEAHDFDGMLKSADALNESCVACHMHYVPELERKPEQQPVTGKTS